MGGGVMDGDLFGPRPGVAFSREFAMPSPDTLSMPPALAFARRHLSGVSVDPFARDCRLATHTNDIDPATAAKHHMEATEFLARMKADGVTADSALLDPPYSPRQIVECYRAIGRPITASDTQNARLYREVRDGIDALLRHGGVVVSFGWNSSGMGKRRGYRLLEVLLIHHGGAHNDTIAIAEIKEAA